jgi:hypothetical protein
LRVSFRCSVRADTYLMGGVRQIRRVLPALLFAITSAVLAQTTHEHKPPVPAAPAAQLSPKEIVQRAMQRDVHNWELEKNYTFTQRIDQRELNSDGSMKSQKSETEEIVFLYDQPYAHLVKRNDQPLTDVEARKVERKLNETMEKRSHESADERQKRLAEFEKRHREEHEFLLEVPEAYDFRIVGEQTINGRAAYVLVGEPRTDFRPTLNAARVLPKLRPKLWIDKDGFEWLRLEAEVIDTITWGGFLLRLHPGSRIELEQTLVNNEVWLPVHAHISFDARVALFKAIRLEVDATFSDYKKFRAESKIISVEEVKH